MGIALSPICCTYREVARPGRVSVRSQGRGDVEEDFSESSSESEEEEESQDRRQVCFCFVFIPNHMMLLVFPGNAKLSLVATSFPGSLPLRTRSLSKGLVY